ncbi:hypothetical protein ZIOFF_020798 [Zingiber officinale]|uniref:Uncharacterized protein n=1 Tax=Zingiber officinale TaxID=94328 RepID=A0A8J5H7K4_ZINOF|nr:hypothetical protein ZIOFF_020798 [Zingiber officinale]
MIASSSNSSNNVDLHFNVINKQSSQLPGLSPIPLPPNLSAGQQRCDLAMPAAASQRGREGLKNFIKTTRVLLLKMQKFDGDSYPEIASDQLVQPVSIVILLQNTSASMGIPLHAANFSDVISTSVQSSSGLQNNWLGKSAHISMADIVKMGRPQGKHPSMPAIASGKPYISENVATSNGPHLNAKQIQASILPSEAKEKLDSFQESTYISDINHGLGTAENQHISTDGWYICDEQPTESVPNFTDISGASAVYANPSALAAPSMVIVGSDLYIDPCLEDFQDRDERPNDKAQPVEYIPVPERKIDVDTAIDGSHSKSIDAYQSKDVEFDHHEVSDPWTDINRLGHRWPPAAYMGPGDAHPDWQGASHS